MSVSLQVRAYIVQNNTGSGVETQQINLYLSTMYRRERVHPILRILMKVLQKQIHTETLTSASNTLLLEPMKSFLMNQK